MCPRLFEYGIVLNPMPDAASETAAGDFWAQSAQLNLPQTSIPDRRSRERRPPLLSFMHQKILVMYLVHDICLFPHLRPPAHCRRRRFPAFIRPRPTTRDENSQHRKSVARHPYSDAFDRKCVWESAQGPRCADAAVCHSHPPHPPIASMAYGRPGDEQPRLLCILLLYLCIPNRHRFA